MGRLKIGTDLGPEERQVNRVEFQGEVASYGHLRIGVIDSGMDIEIAELEGIHVKRENMKILNLVPGEEEMGMVDDLSHGTGIATQIAAELNRFGVVGLAPGAEIYPVRVGNRYELERGEVEFERIIRAFTLVNKLKPHVIVMSLSHHESLWPKEVMEHVLKTQAADTLVVVAAGNDGLELNYGKQCPYVPICVSADNLIKVGALGYSRSNRGEVVDVWARGPAYQWRYESFRPYFGRMAVVRKVWSSSHAVPIVAVAAAKLRRAFPHLEVRELRQRALDQFSMRND